jgi:hypothetical protein
MPESMSVDEASLKGAIALVLCRWHLNPSATMIYLVEYDRTLTYHNCKYTYPLAPKLPYEEELLKVLL